MRKTVLALICGALLAATLGPSLSQAPPPVPALPDVERRTTYVLSAQTGPFSVGFALYGDGTDFGNWVQVYLNGVLQSSATYLISSASGTLATTARPITDGQLTFLVATTGTVQIVGARRPRRTSQFNENRGVSARDLNVIISDLVATQRELWDLKARLPQALPGETLALLPSASARASLPAGFDASGNLTAFTAATPSTAVSAAMAPVVGAADLATARAALGVSSVDLPIGIEADWPGISAPTNWLMEYGQAVSRVTYPELLAAVAPTFPATVTNGSAAVTGISSTEGWPASGMPVECGGHAYTITVTGSTTGTLNTTALAGCTTLQTFPHGNGNATSTFNVPDGRNLAYVGRGNMGGTDRALLNSMYFGADPLAIGVRGGSQSHIMTSGELVAHHHDLSAAATLGESAQHTHNAGNVIDLAYSGGGTHLSIHANNGAQNLATTVENVSHSHQLTGDTADTGSTSPFTLVQPSGVRNKIIYAGH